MAAPDTVQTDLDETLELRLKFDVQGLIPAIICDVKDNAVLMFAFMNAQSLAETRRTGIVHFYSRSRQALWKKGETSGETFAVEEIRVDCDQDVLLVMVKPQGQGNACHTGRRSCFYRKLAGDGLVFG
jgi:phosphoribosyl-AMP cyclohydrolase